MKSTSSITRKRCVNFETFIFTFWRSYSSDFSFILLDEKSEVYYDWVSLVVLIDLCANSKRRMEASLPVDFFFFIERPYLCYSFSFYYCSILEIEQPGIMISWIFGVNKFAFIWLNFLYILISRCSCLAARAFLNGSINTFIANYLPDNMWFAL